MGDHPPIPCFSVIPLNLVHTDTKFRRQQNINPQTVWTHLGVLTVVVKQLCLDHGVSCRDMFLKTLG